MYLLNEVLPNLQISASQTNRDYAIRRYQSFKFAVQKLVDAGLFKNFTDPILQHPYWNHASDSFSVSAPEFTPLITFSTQLIQAVTPYHKALLMVVPKGEPDMISIKIPDPKDFDELVNIARDLQLIFERTIRGSSTKGNVRISNFDTGSFWIEFFVGNPDAVSLVAELCNAAVYLLKNRIEENKKKIDFESLKIESADKKLVIDSVLKAIDKRIDDIADIQTEYIHVKFFPNTKQGDNVPVDEIKKAISILSNLYEKGAEVYPAIETSPEIKEVFPDIKKINSIESRVKQIETKTVKENPEEKDVQK